MSTSIPTPNPRRLVTCYFNSKPHLIDDECQQVTDVPVDTSKPTPNPRPVPYAQHEREILEVIAERDRAEDYADLLAEAISALSAGFSAVMCAVAASSADTAAAVCGAIANMLRETAHGSSAETVARAAYGAALDAAGLGRPLAAYRDARGSDDEDGRLCTCGCPDSCTCYPEPFDESRVARRMDRWTTGGDTDATR